MTMNLVQETERIAAELHDVYIATAVRLGWPVRPELLVPYDELSEPAKELDRAFARWHLETLAAALAAAQQRYENSQRTVAEVTKAFEAAQWCGDPLDPCRECIGCLRGMWENEVRRREEAEAQVRHLEQENEQARRALQLADKIIAQIGGYEHTRASWRAALGRSRGGSAPS